jgi:hypothetical protein
MVRASRFLATMLLEPASGRVASRNRKVGLAEGVGSRVHRISEHMPDRVVHRQFPDDVLSRRIQNQRRQIGILAPKPQQHLPGATQLHHLGEDQMHGLLHTTVGIDVDLAVGGPSKTDW